MFLVKTFFFIQKATCLDLLLVCLFVLLFQETFFSHVVSVGFSKRRKFPSSPLSRERLRAVSKGILPKYYIENNSALNSSQKFVICVHVDMHLFAYIFHESL